MVKKKEVKKSNLWFYLLMLFLGIFAGFLGFDFGFKEFILVVIGILIGYSICRQELKNKG